MHLPVVGAGMLAARRMQGAAHDQRRYARSAMVSVATRWSAILPLLLMGLAFVIISMGLGIVFAVVVLPDDDALPSGRCSAKSAIGWSRTC